ncbi:MAG TPA: substrate-binding domain-containing protein [Opitutaceae bacterium]|jgi:ribose transport system substrate-binding protein|nr:substrate-binding domain-containing protein [Opitutaceae bacterium]HRE03962.1 substrate-binding domain-containing protein [Opitutaceae bacterium]
MKLPSLTCLGLLLGTVGLLLAGCGKKEAASNPSGVKKLTIAVVPKATTHSYWKSAQAGAERAARELGVNLEWQGPLDDSKVADQIGIFNNLAASGIDGIVLAPCDDRALVSHVRTAVRRGLPVAIFDSPLDGKAGVDYINFVATDNKQAGVTAAETLLGLSTAPAFGGRVLMVRFTEGSASTRLREEGFVEKLGSQAKLKLEAQQFTDGSMAGAQRVAETLLGNYVKNNTLELDGIFASNQPTAEGTYNALRALRDKGVAIKAPFVGFDDSELLLQGLQNGIIQALVVQDPDRMGYLGVKSVVDHLQKRAVPLVVDTGVTVKTKK